MKKKPKGLFDDDDNDKNMVKTKSKDGDKGKNTYKAKTAHIFLKRVCHSKILIGSLLCIKIF